MRVWRRINTTVATVAIGASVITGTCGCTISLSGPGVRSSGPGAAPTASVASTGGSQPLASAVATVKATFTAAITAVASFGSPPAAYQMTVLSAMAMRQAIPSFSAALVSDLETSGKAAITRYFGPRQAVAERSVLASAMAQDDNPHVINLGSGVTRVSFGKVAVAGAAATVSARVTSWSKTAARASGSWLTGASARATQYIAALRLTLGGSWQVMRLTATALAR
jgi:hypothetical protein